MLDGNGQTSSFSNPQGIYFDSSSNNLIIADGGYYSIRQMNQSGSLLEFFFKNEPKFTKKTIEKKAMLPRLLEMELKEYMMDKDFWLNSTIHIVLQWILLGIFMLEMDARSERLTHQVWKKNNKRIYIEHTK